MAATAMTSRFCTPGLNRTSEFWVGPTLMSMAWQVMRPRGVAFAIAICLDPAYLALCKSLPELVAAGPPLFHRAGDHEHDPRVTWRPGSPPSGGSRAGPR
jgi:hypothetical protein